MKLVTRLRSTAMRVLASERYMEVQHALSRLASRGERSTVHYFHQVDVPSSHMAVQVIPRLASAYPSIKFKFHLVPDAGGAYKGDSEKFVFWAQRDATLSAPGYGLTFSTDKDFRPMEDQVNAANAALAGHVECISFPERALEVGERFWKGDVVPFDTDKAGEVAAQLGAGAKLRSSWGHYAGGMLYFEGEWYSFDRIRHLERRLQGEGHALGMKAREYSTPSGQASEQERDDASELQVPEPDWGELTKVEASNLTLTYFLSLRSPYTAAGHMSVLRLIEETGVHVHVRPVLPTLMRGVPLPFQKQMYMMADAAREARWRGCPFGRIVDPFGDPVRRAFELYPGAVRLGAGMDFVTSYLRAVWWEGVDISADHGLQWVAGEAGLDWSELKAASEESESQSMLSENVSELNKHGIWGVPSFIVGGGAVEEEPMVCWGQDRIWLVAREISKRAKQ